MIRSMVFQYGDDQLAEIKDYNKGLLINTCVEDLVLDLEGTLSGDVKSEIFNENDFIKLTITPAPPNQWTAADEKLNILTQTGWIRDTETMAVCINNIVSTQLRKAYGKPSEFQGTLLGEYVQQHGKVCLSFDLRDIQITKIDVSLSDNLKYALGELKMVKIQNTNDMWYLQSTKMYYPLPARHIYITCEQIEPNYYNPTNKDQPIYKQVLNCEFSFTPGSRISIPTNRMIIKKYQTRFDIKIFNENWVEVKPFENIILELQPLPNEEAQAKRKMETEQEYLRKQQKQKETIDQINRRITFLRKRSEIIRERGDPYTRAYYKSIEQLMKQALLKDDQPAYEWLQEQLNNAQIQNNGKLDDVYNQLAQLNKNFEQKVLQRIEQTVPEPDPDLNIEKSLHDSLTDRTKLSNQAGKQLKRILETTTQQEIDRATSQYKLYNKIRGQPEPDQSSDVLDKLNLGPGLLDDDSKSQQQIDRTTSLYKLLNEIRGRPEPDQSSDVLDKLNLGPGLLDDDSKSHYPIKALL